MLVENHYRLDILFNLLLQFTVKKFMEQEKKKRPPETRWKDCLHWAEEKDIDCCGQAFL